MLSYQSYDTQLPVNYALIRSGDIHVNPVPCPPYTSPVDLSHVQKKGLNFLYINTRSLLPKLSNIKLISQQTKAAAICITETWIDSTVTDNEIFIEGYNVLRCDRDRNGDGVCVYIRCDIAFNPRNDLRREGDEAVWCNLLLPKSKPILLGAIYRSQTQTGYVPRLESILDSIPLNQETFVLGDFNICTLKESLQKFSLSRAYVDCLSGAGFKNIITEPTRVTDTPESCLDHILCNNCDKVYQCGVMPTGLSDHFLVYCTRKSVRVPLHSRTLFIFDL